MNPKERACSRLEGPDCIHCVEKEPLNFWCEWNGYYLPTPELNCPYYESQDEYKLRIALQIKEFDEWRDHLALDMG